MLFPNLPAGLTVLCLVTLIHATDKVCYHPNGSPSDDVPCDPGSPFSMCCSSPNACLASGLCKSVATNETSADADKFIRATCTDMTWTSDVCPPFCMPSTSPHRFLLDKDESNTNPPWIDSGSSNISAFNLNLSQNDVHIRQCHNQNQTFALAARFCCGFADEKAQCCDTPDALFELSVAATSANSPVALNPADGSPEPWKGISLSSPTSSTSGPTTPCSSDTVAPSPAGVSTDLSSQPSTSPSATPKTPFAVAPSSASAGTSSSAQPTTADPGSSDSSVPSTDPPSSVSSPTAPASSTPASSRPTTSKTPTTAAAASAPATALADSTSAGSSLGNSGKSADSDSNSPPDPDYWSSKGSSSRLSTGAIAGIGFGVSIATAGLVTISVYFFARRRLYMKQKRKWEEHMRATGGSGAGAGGPAMVAVQTQTADGKPAVVMLAGGQTVSPVSMRDLKDVRWDAQSVSEYSELESKRQSVATTRSNGSIQQSKAASTQAEPREGRTVTWFARHSIYEMG